MLLPSIDKCRMVFYLFMMLQPFGYLGIFVLVVSCTVCILCKVDVKALHLIGIIDICSSK